MRLISDLILINCLVLGLNSWAPVAFAQEGDLDYEGNVEEGLDSESVINELDQTTGEVENPPPMTLEKRVEEVEAVEEKYGAYKVHLAYAKPQFALADEYELVYGNTTGFLMLGVDAFFLDNMGVSFRFGYYKDDGSPVSETSEDNYESDEFEESEITLVPLQMAAVFQASPFAAKWIVASAWVGGEAIYFQEIRVPSESEGSASSSDDSSSDDDGVLSDTGWRYGTLFGGSLSFSLNALDERSVSSLRNIGMKSVYLTPFVEVVAGVAGESFDLSRTNLGLAFSFETL